MNYKIININTSASDDPASSILIIYTGGTFGMVYNEDGALIPFNFGAVLEKIPELRYLEIKITVISFPKPTDSSSIDITHWQSIGYIIYENYSQYDGFVILHGTDTMAYSASALSFMLEGLNKPVIFTGAQIPIGKIRSDARENLVTALEIASQKKNNLPVINEVCIYFNHFLLRGNRSQKVRSSTFAAFESYSYPFLAESGITIEYNHAFLLPFQTNRLKLLHQFETNIALIKLFPNMSRELVKNIFQTPKLRGVILETYGSGNIPGNKWFIDYLINAIKNKITILNISQAVGGEVVHGRYLNSRALEDIGVISGRDITLEAGITKLMHVLGNEQKPDIISYQLSIPLRGEMDY